MALRVSSEVEPVSGSTTSTVSPSVARVVFADDEDDSTVVRVIGSRPFTVTLPARFTRSDSTLTEMTSPRPGSENQVKTWVGAALWRRSWKCSPPSST